jgi:hypothetical protein
MADIHRTSVNGRITDLEVGYRHLNGLHTSVVFHHMAPCTVRYVAIDPSSTYTDWMFTIIGCVCGWSEGIYLLREFCLFVHGEPKNPMLVSALILVSCCHGDFSAIL